MMEKAANTACRPRICLRPPSILPCCGWPLGMFAITSAFKFSEDRKVLVHEYSKEPGRKGKAMPSHLPLLVRPYFTLLRYRVADLNDLRMPDAVAAILPPTHLLSVCLTSYPPLEMRIAPRWATTSAHHR